MTTITLMLKLIILVGILAALSYNYAFNYNFYVDDWNQLLGASLFPQILHSYTSIHPVSTLEFKSLFPFLKFRPAYWQFIGYVLKILDSLSMIGIIFAITNSKKVAIYSSLIFAVFVGGIESVTWVSAHSSAIVIPLVSLGFYFWIKSRNEKIKAAYLISLGLFGVSIIAEPGRAYMAVILVALWELLSFYQEPDRKNLFLFLRLLPLFLMLPLLGFWLKRIFSTTPDPSVVLSGFTDKSIAGLISSMGNLMFGWILILDKITERSFVLPAFYWLTIAVYIVFFIILGLFIWKKSNTYKIIIFLFLWMPLFFLPNWLTQGYIKSGGNVLIENRYFAFSAVGFVGLMAYGLSFLSKQKVKWILPAIIILNIYSANKVLKQYFDFRSLEFHQKLWDQIDNDVPKDEKNSIFVFTGGDYIRVRVFDWTSSIPFGVRRGITNIADFPIFLNDRNLTSRLVCEKNVERPTPFAGTFIQPDPILLSHVHAWDLNNGKLRNVSENEREQVKLRAKCSL